MTAITNANGFAYGGIASMLRDTLSPSAAPVSGKTPEARSNTPKDTVELSDYAKTMLTRSRTERAAANKLAALVAEVVLNGKGQTANKTGIKPDDDGTALFKALTGQLATSAISGNATEPKALSEINPADVGAYMNALLAAHTRPDGTTERFSVTVHDAVKVPSTPEEIDQWFATDGQSYVVGASQVNNPEYSIMAQAIQNRTMKIQNAMDIPGLNFRNTIIYEAGGIGASVNGTYSYNRDADIFKDPTMSYSVSSMGIVLSWKKDPNA